MAYIVTLNSGKQVVIHAGSTAEALMLGTPDDLSQATAKSARPATAAELRLKLVA
jgi:hypothetical protein